MPTMERGKDPQIAQLCDRISQDRGTPHDVRLLGRALAARGMQEKPTDFDRSNAEVLRGIVKLLSPELAELLSIVDRGESIMIAPQPIIDDEAAEHEFERIGSHRAEIPSIAPADQPEKAAVA